MVKVDEIRHATGSRASLVTEAASKGTNDPYCWSEEGLAKEWPCGVKCVP